MTRLRPRVILPESAPEVLSDGEPVDSYAGQVVKYIPAETIAAYQAVLGGVTLAEESEQRLLLTVAATFGVIFTFLWTLLGAQDKAKKEPLAWSQAIIATIAFGVWLLAIDSPFVYLFLDSWSQLYGSVVLILGTILILPLLGRLLARIIGK